MYLSMHTLIRMRTIDSRKPLTVKDLILRKMWHMLHNPLYFFCLYWSLRKRGQTVPLAIGIDEETGECYLVNGHHRVILAWLMRWDGMQACQDPEQSVDRPWSAEHAGAAAGDW